GRIRPAAITAELAGELAELTRRSYAGSDPLPGLPAPDGQFETPATLLGALGDAVRIHTAAVRGRLVAALRVSPAADCWRVSRISVLPGYRGRGLVRLLLDEVAGRARGHRVDWLELDAVVERCLPPLYARLGFSVCSNWPSPDKPMSEVTMRRSSAGPCDPVPLGWRGARLTEHREVVAWFLDGRTLLRLSRPASGDPLADLQAAAGSLAGRGLTLAGVDLSRRDPTGRIETFPGCGRDLPEHLLPRSRHPDALALWRPAPGREPPVSQLVPRSLP
ncbi:MAG TPA: GNAT family N-acetyltransferase, partial [Jatrophihabitans sp.]